MTENYIQTINKAQSSVHRKKRGFIQNVLAGMFLVFLFVWNIPKYLIIGFIKTYRVLISPLYGDVCRYYPSCSAYTLEAVTVHGAVKGSLAGAWRILRCNPFTQGGVDHVKASQKPWPDNKPLPTIVIENHPRIPEK